jgi:DNA-binding NarL/FixJ family response regulator
MLPNSAKSHFGGELMRYIKGETHALKLSPEMSANGGLPITPRADCRTVTWNRRLGLRKEFQDKRTGQNKLKKKSEKIRVLSVDDHPVVRDGITALVNLQGDMMLIAASATGREALEQFSALNPDIVLVDLGLPDMSGFDLIKKIKDLSPDARIIVLSAYEGDVDIRRALDAGAQGYVAKGIVREELLETIRCVHAGKPRLPSEVAQKLVAHMTDEPISPRELNVLPLMASGKRNKEIACELAIAEDTVKMHVRNIFSKLQVNDRTEAVTIALRRGIIRL